MTKKSEQETKKKLDKLNSVIGIEKNKPINNIKKSSSFSTKEVVVLLLITAIVGLILGGTIIYKIENNGAKKSDTELQEFIKTYEDIIENYNGKEDKKTLINGAITGMLEQLDENSTFLDSEVSNNLNIHLEGSYQGLGIQVYSDKSNNLIIYSVFKNSPADKAGLKPGDIITKLNGKSTKKTSTKSFASKIQKLKDQPITITYVRNNKEATIKVNIAQVNLESVESKMINKNDKKIGYIYVQIFASNTYKQFKKHLQKLEEKNIDSLIIDLRANSGGYLSTSEQMISLFLDSSHVIYQIEKNNKKTKYYSKGQTTKKYKIIMLVDENSASASEIMTSALKEQYGATIIGKTTYGKGTVQEMQDLTDGNKYKLTTKNWLTSKGEWINKKGIKPDIEIEFNQKYYDEPKDENDTQLQKAIEEVIK